MTKSLLCIAPTDWAELRSKRAITYYTRRRRYETGRKERISDKNTPG